MDDRTLTSALTVLADHATETPGGTRVLMRAAKILATRGIPQDALDELERRGCIAPYGEHRIRIVRMDLPMPELMPEPIAPAATADDDDVPTTDPVVMLPAALPGRPVYVLLADLANSERTHGEYGVKFRLGVIRDRARELGVIAFAAVLGDARTVSETREDDCYIAGFTFIHCTHLVNRDALKDTTDPQIADLAARFAALPGIDGVIVVGDDTDFLAVHHRIRDSGKRCTFLAFRDSGRLAAGADVLPIYPARFHWTPDIALDLLRALPVSAGAGREQMFQRFAREAPLPARVLRVLLRLPMLAEGGAPVDLRAIAEGAWDRIDPIERRHIGQRDLVGFIRRVSSTTLLTRSRVRNEDGERIQFRVRWDHPFAAAFLASRGNGNGNAPLYDPTTAEADADWDTVLEDAPV